MPLHDQSKGKSPWTTFSLHLSASSVHMLHCDRHFSLLWNVCFLPTEHSSGYMIVFGREGGMVFIHKDCMQYTKKKSLFHNAHASLLHPHCSAWSQLSENPLSWIVVHDSLKAGGMLLKLGFSVTVIYKLGNYRDFCKFHLFYYYYLHTSIYYSNYITHTGPAQRQSLVSGAVQTQSPVAFITSW